MLNTEAVSTTSEQNPVATTYSTLAPDGLEKEDFIYLLTDLLFPPSFYYSITK